jgi:hypothetical protein
MYQPLFTGRSCWAAVDNKIGDSVKLQQVSSHDHGRSCAAQGPTGGGLSGAETGHILAVNQICWVPWTEPASLRSRSCPASPSKKGCSWAGPTGPGISASRTRRSSSDSPPQTPVSWPDSIAHLMQESTTSHRRHTAFASSIAPAGYADGAVPTGHGGPVAGLWRAGP